MCGSFRVRRLTLPVRFASLARMKFLIPVLAGLLFAGCTRTINTHRDDFSPAKGKGPWTDYYRSVLNRETPVPPKEAANEKAN